MTLAGTRAPKPRLVSPVFLLVMLSTFAYFVAVGMITPTLPRYVEGPLGLGNAAVGLTVGAFAISAVLLRPWVGTLGDTRGRKLLIVAGGSAVGLSIAGYVVGTSLFALIVLRLVTGLGEAFFYVGAASVINDLAPDDRRGEALSYFSLALFGGLAVGSFAGESVLEAAGFSPVWVAAGAAALFAGLVGLLVPETRPPEAYQPKSGRIINRGALLPGGVLATSIWGLATFSAFIPLYALEVGLSGSRFLFVTNSVITMGIRLFGARLPDRLGPQLSGRAALVCTMAGLFLIGVWADPVGLFIGTAIYSGGHALAFPALMTLAINRSPVSERASVVGTFTAFFDASFGVGAMSAGAIAAALGYRGAFISAAVVAFSGLFLLAAAGREGKKETSDDEPRDAGAPEAVAQR